MLKPSSVIKLYHLLLNAVPVVIMIVLIPIISNDFILTIAYMIIMTFSFMVRHEKKEFRILALGFVVMVACEYLFISTGVETFQRNSLFGVMPLWLPFLWAYGFVAVKRAVEILGMATDYKP